MQQEEDILDLFEDEEVDEVEQPQPAASRGDRRLGALSSRVGGIEAQLNEIKGLIKGNKATPVEETEPEGLDDAERVAWLLSKKLEKIESTISEERSARQKEQQEAAFRKTLKSALRGLDFGKNDDVAQVSIQAYLKAHPGDAEAVRKYAETLAHRFTGKLQGALAKEYADKKKAAEQSTARPGKGVANAVPTQQQEPRRDRSGKRNNGLEDARAAMLARLAQSE